MAIGNIGNDVIQTFGTAAQPIRNEHPPMRDNVMEFRRGPLMITVSMSSFYDEAKKEYGPYTAGISVANNKRYSSLPADPKVLHVQLLDDNLTDQNLVISFEVVS